jgi:hypothetical protein
MVKIDLSEHIAQIYQSYLNKVPMSILAESCGCSVDTIRKNFKKYGYKLRYDRKKVDIDLAKIEEQINTGFTIREIANNYGMSYTGLLNKLRNSNIKRNRREKYIKPENGTIFNYWEFLGEDSIGECGKILLLCNCKCGTTKFVDYYSLKHNISKSCGCHQIERQKEFHWTGYGDISGSYWSSLQHGAESRNIEFNITIEYAWSIYELQNGFCKVSNLPIIFLTGGEKKKKTGEYFMASLDRINNDLGYIEGNVQWVAKEINYLKGKLSMDRLLFFCLQICENNL